MLQLLTCAKGHSWETEADEGAAVGRAVCPVCGDAVDLLPLFDLAPDAITTTPAPLLPQAPPLRDAAGKPVVAGYEIQEDLGRSPQGVRLFRAKQLLVNRTVLLKIVVARDDAGQTGWGALRGEAAALGRLSHPNIVQILDAGERERQLFYNAVEWVEGPTLAEHTAGKPMPPRLAARLVEVLARAVHAAHEQGQVHRGLRPACVRLQPAPEGPARKRKAEAIEPPFWLATGGARCLPRIAGFGLARRPVEGDAADVELYEDTPAGLAPEQAWGRAREIGLPSDIYALGAILYELLAGRPPFRGRTPGETLDFIRSGEPPSLLRQGPTPAIDLVSVCRKAMQRYPRNRYATALDLAEDLRAFTSCRPVKARPSNILDRTVLWVRRRPTAAVLLLVCVLAAVGVLTAYLFGAGEAAASKTEVESIRGRATAAENREAGLRKDLTESQKREQRSACFQRIFLADRESLAGRSERARQLLDECPPDLRQWEWHYLNYRLTLNGAPEYLSLTGPGPDEPVTSIAFSPDGRWLAAASGPETVNFNAPDDRKVRIWTLPETTTNHLLSGLRWPIRQVAFSPDGKRLAAAGYAQDNFGGRFGELKEWDPMKGKVLSTPQLNNNLPTGVAYSPDGKLLVLMDDRGIVHAFVPGAKNETPLPMQTGGDWMSRVFHVTPLSPDGAKLALIATGSSAVQIYDTQRSRMTSAMQHSGDVTALAFNPETNLLASASRDTTVKVWDVQQGRLIATLQGHTAAITDVSFTCDGRRLATSSEDGDVRIWDPATGQEVLKLTPFDKDAVGGSAVTAVQFSPARDDWRLAVAHGNEVRIFGPARP